MRHFRTALAAAAAAALAWLAGPAAAQDAPLQVADGLFDLDDAQTLGLERLVGVETFTIFHPEANTHQFSNGVVVFPFKHRLYAQWQSSRTDEDAPETVVVYATSDDRGATWSEPAQLTVAWSGGYVSNGGWWSDGETLVAYLNVWPQDVEPRGGHVEYVTSTDGERWSKPAAVAMADGSPLPGIFEQDPHALPDGRIINAAISSPA
ncbi:exo-alpha-sialidase [Consotaella aegiceratis]|uniref:exo-alpha-sialidase n=1 Tax=Consotaella aegiceratis TaxID=3097961 RepID=UPI002F408FBD